MNGLDKVLPSSPVNRAADELVTYLASLRDTAVIPQPLFESVEQGVWVPAQNPNGGNSPACRVWYREPAYRIDTPQFFTGVREINFYIGIYLWLPTKDQITATDGVTDGTTTFRSASGLFNSAMQDQRITIGGTSATAGTTVTVAAYVSRTELVLDAALPAATGQTWWVRGDIVNPTRILTDYVDYVMQNLQLLDDSGIGWEWSGEFWGPKAVQDARIVMYANMSRYNYTIPVMPPWYAAAIPFLADVYNLPPG